MVPPQNMQPTGIEGVFKKQNKLFTVNPENCKGIKVYNEKIVSKKGKQFRSWNPYRSKLSAAILKGFRNINIESNSKILYLGAATGTTVSHISDIVQDGIIYAVENSPVAIKKLLQLCEKRHNIIPILADANHPDRYSNIVTNVDFLYQDVSQKNQAEIFVSNASRYLKKKRTGILMVKARSIDVALKPKKTYEFVCSELRKNELKIKKKIDLTPYKKDHVAIIIST